MPCIRVNGLIGASGETRLSLETALCEAVIRTKELGITSWDDIECFFPRDLKDHREIVIEVFELWKMPGRTKRVQDKLADALCEAAYAVLRSTDITAIIHPLFDRKKQGFAMKRNPNNHKS